VRHVVRSEYTTQIGDVLIIFCTYKMQVKHSMYILSIVHCAAIFFFTLFFD